MFSMYEIIDRKKRKAALTKEEIGFFIKGVTDGAVPDYQIAALLMAIRLNGMTDEETLFMTTAVAESGHRLELPQSCGVCADKHSTGGVSDATTLIVVPVLAALGVKIAKLSGRGLGHTGGTLDKLEAFKGYNVNQSGEDFIRILNRTGAALCGQTGEFAPADKKLYALRDVTATVDSIPLIASSVMGKKLASGADIIVLDVKYGSGAFMKTSREAKKLARAMVKIGTAAGKKTAALVTSMEQPLGVNIGSNLEVEGAVAVLKGARNDLEKVSLALAEKIYCLAVRGEDAANGAAEQPVSAALRKAARKEIVACIKSGSALAKLKEIVEAHGGTFCESFGRAKYITAVSASESGYVTAVDASMLGHVNVLLGGGRLKKGDTIDHSAGLVLYARLNNYVKEGDTLAEIHYNNKDISEQAEALVRQAFKIGEEKIKPPRLIIEI